MTMAEDFDILLAVKAGLGITGEFHDETLSGYIDEVKEFLLDSGVKPEIVDAKTSAGIIIRGVSDLWNYGSGGTKLSLYFMQRAAQLVYKSVKIDSGEDNVDEEDAKIYILRDGAGNEVVAVLVSEETIFTAKAEDIREGKVAATASGITMGTMVVGG